MHDESEQTKANLDSLNKKKSFFMGITPSLAVKIGFNLEKSPVGLFQKNI
ncbi:hypothetical protein DET65_1643 [Sunxiuqinia elliptica]|uniref:Uncharacterized protein n=1 Tax=Sunxiuqinia elliptica TaxID=655355 RepID=A0A4R6HD17_9BACT|nr:hypothetical protein DET52_1011085 [Sunxiuqinia elliptica]TDO65263.1 hypothetical protein DET65_1643 [Sunxiuqinia elliptica]